MTARWSGRAAGLEALPNGRGLAAVDAGLDAGPLAPATARVLAHARVVERALARIELGVAPHGAQRGRAAAALLAGTLVDARPAVTAGRGDDPLPQPIALDPALHDLDALERRGGVGWVAQRARQEDRALRSPDLRERRQRAAHRDALGIAARHAVRGVAEVVGQLPAAEEAHHRPRPTGAVGLPPQDRLEERVAAVLLGPEHPRARPGCSPGESISPTGSASIAGPSRSAVPFEATLVREAGGGQVGVGARNETETEGVLTEAVVIGEAALQRLAHHVGPLVRRLLRSEIAREEAQVVGSPLRRLLEAARLVRRVAEQEALGVTLVLHHLDQALVARSQRDLRAAQLLAGDDRRAERRALAQVRVVRDRDTTSHPGTPSVHSASSRVSSSYPEGPVSICEIGRGTTRSLRKTTLRWRWPARRRRWPSTRRRRSS